MKVPSLANGVTGAPGLPAALHVGVGYILALGFARRINTRWVLTLLYTVADQTHYSDSVTISIVGNNRQVRVMLEFAVGTFVDNNRLSFNLHVLV